ncbi:MAG: DUF4169 family protein [Pseudomonadota bacterium]
MIINLNKARKAKARTDRKTKAAQNAVIFGRTKAEKQRDTLEKARLAKATDHAKLPPCTTAPKNDL